MMPAGAPYPLTRLNPWYPGQFGVPGTANETGLRVHTKGTIFYVDPNYPGVVDNRDGTDPNAPLATVQAALDKCEDYAGDVVLVMANDQWPYSTRQDAIVRESAVCSASGVRIIGVSPSSSVGVPWQAAAAGEFALTVTGCDVLVEGFAFLGTGVGSSGIYAEWDGVTMFADNVTVRNCMFYGTGGALDTAIQLEYSWNSEVSGCIFHECDYGVYVDPAGSGIVNCRFLGNWFDDCNTGALALDDADACLIAGNWIFNDEAVQGNVATDTMIEVAAGSENLVCDNVLSCLLPAASNGDYDDCNTAGTNDAWVNNRCLNGPSVTNPT